MSSDYNFSAFSQIENFWMDDTIYNNGTLIMHKGMQSWIRNPQQIQLSNTLLMESWGKGGMLHLSWL